MYQESEQKEWKEGDCTAKIIVGALIGGTLTPCSAQYNDGLITNETRCAS